jgi:GDP-L-fucose synthase
MDMFPGWAKRMAEMQIQAYKIQYGLNTFSVVRPCNVYGPGDNFDPENAMVIPTLMYRIRNKENPVMVWGDGSAVRDFAFSRDVAEGTIQALYYGTGKYPFLNLGSGNGYTIRELVETLNEFIDFNYHFDTSKPSGFPKRVMDISLARDVIRYNPDTSLIDGLKETWEWFLTHQDEYEKKKNYFAE